ncbi:unnamed protein product [Sphagnum balticum]
MMAMERVAMVVVLQQQQQRLCLEAQRNEVRVCCATAPQLWSLRPAGRDENATRSRRPLEGTNIPRSNG